MRLLGIISFATACSSTSAWSGTEAPAQLHGKSIIVNWHELRIQKGEREQRFYPYAATLTVSIYISELGRVFSRQNNSTPDGNGSLEQSPEKSSQANVGRIAFFNKNAINFVLPMDKGGLRRVDITLNGQYSQCNAIAHFLKREGAQTAFARSLVTKELVEFQSISMGNEECTIQDGNVFEQASSLERDSDPMPRRRCRRRGC